MAKKKEASPATPAPSAESTVEAYEKVKGTPEWKGLFSLLIIFLANCIKWNKLARATEFLSKIVEGANSAYKPVSEPSDPFETESIFLPSWPLRPYSDKPKQYFLPGTTERIKSVTTINKNLGWSANALMFWARKSMFEGCDPIERRDSAADSGKVLHYLCECYLKKNRPEVNRIPSDVMIQAKLGFVEFLKWEKENNVQWVASELSLVGSIGKERFSFGGTVDGLAIINENLVLVDFKSGSGVYFDQICQVAAYRRLCQEGEYCNLSKVMIIHIPKGQSKLTVINVEDDALNYGLSIFEDLCRIESKVIGAKKSMENINAILGQKSY